MSINFRHKIQNPLSFQIGPDTYLMAARGAAFNSRVRNYREELFGMGAPTVKQGFLGVRNRDITVRERRRYTDILRETTQGLEPKSHEQSTALLQKAPSATAIERIKADIEKVTPCATKKNDDGSKLFESGFVCNSEKKFCE